MIRRSLALQVLLLVFGATACIVGLSTVVSMMFGQQAMLHSVTENGARVSKLLWMAIEKPMILGDDAATTREFAAIHANFPSVDIDIASFNGSVTYSTNPADVRKSVDALHDPRVVAPYKNALRGQAAEGRILTIAGKERYVQITPVPNGPT